MKKRPLTNRWIIFSIITMGFAEILIQLVTAREFLSVFYGNELVIGILLANWLLISGIASYLGRRASSLVNKERLLIVFHIVIAILLPLQVFLIRNLYRFAFTRGELVGVSQIFVTAFIMLLPVCAVTGFSLPLFTAMYREDRARRVDARRVSRVYIFDSLSNIIGGFLFSFFLIYVLDHFQIAALIFMVNIGAVVAYLVRKRSYAYAYALGLVIIMAGILAFTVNIDLMVTDLQYSENDVVVTADSPYARYAVFSSGGQLDFIVDGMPAFTTDDVAGDEERVHYVLQQRSGVENVLMISGAVRGTTDEVRKYGPDRIDYVEIDPVMIALGHRYTKSLEGVNVFNEDPRVFLRHPPVLYDAVIIDVPDPSTAALNRLYTAEFFADLKRACTGDAVIGLSISAGENYISEGSALMGSAVVTAVAASFRNVILLPGDTAFIVASDAPISYSNYTSLMRGESGIETQYIADYGYARLDEERIGRTYGAYADYPVQNRDFRPVAYYYHLVYWLEQFRADYTVLLVALLAFTVFVFLRMTRIGFAVFAAGFAGLSIELVILLGFQVLYGSAYTELSVIITAFMAGLAVGAFYVDRNIDSYSRKCLVIIPAFLFLFALAVPALLLWLQGSLVMAPVASYVIFPLLTLLLGSLVGSLFPVAASFYGKGSASGIAGSLYFFDYAGGFIGALLVSALLIPLLGMFTTCVLTAVLCLGAAVVNSF